jgi:tripartite-type tricarboxylate transporter receptor subunit TctC
MKRLASSLVALVAVLAGSAGLEAQTYPTKPITIVVGFPPGGPTDTVARVMAERMRDTLGQSVVVENVAGAGGTLGGGKVARSAPDGYTLLVGQWTTQVGGGAVHKLDYHVMDDFAPIARLTSSALWILGRRDLPAKDMKEFVAWLKANPGKATAATVGFGSAAQMCLVDFRNKTGTQFEIVQYRGGAPAMQDILGGQVDFTCLEAAQTLPHYHGDKIRVFGVVDDKRWNGAPEVPTLAEGGVPGVALEFWHALWAPKGTPKPVLEKLNAAVVEAFADPAVQKRFAAIGHTIPPRDQQTREALAKHHKAELDKWWPIMKAAGIQPK